MGGAGGALAPPTAYFSGCVAVLGTGIDSTNSALKI